MVGHNSSIFRFSDVEVHEGELHIRRNGDVLPVEPKAFRSLVHLLRNPGRLVAKDELIQAGWGDTAVTDNSRCRNRPNRLGLDGGGALYGCAHRFRENDNYRGFRMMNSSR